MMDHDDPADPENDPDFIPQDGAVDAPISPMGAGFQGLWGSPTPVFVPKTSTPLEEGEDGDEAEGDIPTFALWPMKYLQHAQFLSRPEVHIRESYGAGDHRVYVMDDGRKHCLVSRMVDTSPDGCTYCLVGQIPLAAYERLVDDVSFGDGIFSTARHLALCAVFESRDAVSNVSIAQSFANVDEVPTEYLPPGPAIAFTELPEE
jgi:hypothetical protein